MMYYWLPFWQFASRDDRILSMPAESQTTFRGKNHAADYLTEYGEGKAASHALSTFIELMHFHTLHWRQWPMTVHFGFIIFINHMSLNVNICIVSSRFDFQPLGKGFHCGQLLGLTITFNLQSPAICPCTLATKCNHQSTNSNSFCQLDLQYCDTSASSITFLCVGKSILHINDGLTSWASRGATTGDSWGVRKGLLLVVKIWGILAEGAN